MAQLLVRDLSDETKERLRARAKAKGRSLEAEARDVLETAANTAQEPDAPKGGLGTELVRKMSRHKVTDADIDELERLIKEGRKHWSSRKIEFD